MLLAVYCSCSLTLLSPLNHPHCVCVFCCMFCELFICLCFCSVFTFQTSFILMLVTQYCENQSFTVIQSSLTLIFCCLDYSNAFFTCISWSSLTRLQLGTTQGARLLTKCRGWSHITPILGSLYWLPEIFRIHFKILLLRYKALHGQIPAYPCF